MHRQFMRPAILYACSAIAVLLPLLFGGFILTLDLIFTPKPHYMSEISNLTPLYAFFTSLNLVLNGAILEKTALISILAMAGLGVHKLVASRRASASYAAGLLYVINPFTYARLMAGQYLVLAGYALFPWFIGSLVRFCHAPSRKTSLKLATWTIAIGFLDLHYLGFAAIAAIIALILTAIHERRDLRRLKLLATWSLLIALIVIVANSFWLVAAALGHTTQSQLITSFTNRYFLSFHTIADPHFGQIFNTLALYGFWGDAQNLYGSPKTAAPWWWIITLVILVIGAIGAVAGWRTNRLMISLVLLLGIMGLVLAQGIMGSPFASFNYWVMQHMWIYRAYREPAKFVGLIALAVCYCFGLGADWLLERTSHMDLTKGVLTGLLIAIPFAYTPTMLWGAAGQLHTVDYPKDWYALNQKLDREHSQGKILFLPWHQYMYFNFAHRLIANPAQLFFDRPVIQGDNAEIGLIEYQSQSPISRTIQTQILSPVTGQTDLGPKLHALGIEYVALAKESDFQNYQWLNRSPGLTLTSDSPTLRVYKVTP